MIIHGICNNDKNNNYIATAIDKTEENQNFAANSCLPVSDDNSFNYNFLSS